MKNILLMPSDNSSSSGAFRSMAKLAQLLINNHGYNVLILLRKKEGTGIRLLDEYGLDYKIVKSYNWVVPIDQNPIKTAARCYICSFLNLFAINRIRKIIRDQNIELVHINTSYLYVGAVAAKKEDVPVVWHIREFLEEDQSNKIWSPGGLRLIGQSNTIVAISDEIKEKYKRLIPEGHIVRIYNGIDESDFYEKNRQIFNTDLIRIICVGHLSKGKGQDTIIRACSLLKNRGIDRWTLTLIGSGDMENEYKQLTRDLGISSQVIFAGFQRDVVPFYKNADILIMSSKAEAFGRVTVEAMMSGLLVVGSNSGATPSIIDYGNAGYMFEKDNAEDLAEKLIHVFEHKDEAKEIALKGQKRAMDNYRASVNAFEVARLYQCIETGEVYEEKK